MLTVVDGFRYQPVAVSLFGAGLLVFALAGALLIVASWSRGRTLRTAAILAGAGLLLYLPQFYAPPALRIAHGVLLAVGCLLLAVSYEPRTRIAVLSPGSGTVPA